MGIYKDSLKKLLSEKAFPAGAFDIASVFRQHPLVVYGAGESFHYFKEIVMQQYGYTPSVVLDRRFAVGDTFEGALAFPPDDFDPSADMRRDAVVVICLGNQSYYDDVYQSLSHGGSDISFPV